MGLTVHFPAGGAEWAAFNSLTISACKLAALSNFGLSSKAWAHAARALANWPVRSYTLAKLNQRSGEAGFCRAASSSYPTASRQWPILASVNPICVVSTSFSG